AAHELATALLPAATAAPGDLRLQFARLRALLRCGGDKEVARLLPRLQRAVAAQPFEALALAETLTEARSPKTFRAVAEQCVAVASRAAAASARAGGLSRLVFATRHKLAVRVGEPQTAAAIVAEYRASTAFPGDLNDDAWLLMTELSTRGRFDALALALCQVMRDQAGSDLLHSHQDTLALALYLNGFGDEAEGMEEMAVQGSQQQPDYVARLERYRRARPPAVPPAPK
ncbi:MAG TPA: hypothetical protein VK348_11450, partial [Planctomycetota bacterium]|nr:hypothetical protein [Planctomycetota bacterium]